LVSGSSGVHSTKHGFRSISRQHRVLRRRAKRKESGAQAPDLYAQPFSITLRKAEKSSRRGGMCGSICIFRLFCAFRIEQRTFIASSHWGSSKHCRHDPAIPSPRQALYCKRSQIALLRHGYRPLSLWERVRVRAVWSGEEKALTPALSQRERGHSRVKEKQPV